MRVGFGCRGIYQKSLHQKLRNQSAGTSFISGFVFVQEIALTWAWTSTGDQKTVYRFTINHEDFSFFFRLLSSREANLRGFSFYLGVVHFLFPQTSHMYTPLINHLFRLFYYVTSINYSSLRFVYWIQCLIDQRKLLNFCVYTSLKYLG